MKQDIKNKISKSTRLKALISLRMNVSTRTVENWLSKDSDMLSTYAVIDVVCAELKIKRDEVIAEKVHA